MKGSAANASNRTGKKQAKKPLLGRSASEGATQPPLASRQVLTVATTTERLGCARELDALISKASDVTPSGKDAKMLLQGM
jgi:hypothetical protein